MPALLNCSPISFTASCNANCKFAEAGGTRISQVNPCRVVLGLWCYLTVQLLQLNLLQISEARRYWQKKDDTVLGFTSSDSMILLIAGPYSTSDALTNNLKDSRLPLPSHIALTGSGLETPLLIRYPGVV
jgi:hypothetical protein